MNYYRIILISLFLTNGFVHAQDEEYEDYGESYEKIDPAEISHKAGYDKEHIKVQRFDSKKWEEIVGDRDYLQEKSVSKRKHEDDSLSAAESERSSKRLKRGDGDDEEEESETNDSMTASPFQSLLLQLIVYAAAIGIIVYILFLIFKNISVKPNTRVSTDKLENHATNVEDIKELEIDRLLREARASGNYRLVIRIYFLGLLQTLDEVGFIIWKKDKTNRDYLLEVFSRERYYQEVKGLTICYEEVWYGDHNLPAQSYEAIITSFNDIQIKLKDSKLP